MNTILPSCCLEHSGTVLCVNTRETSAILCWLRRGDQLGNRQNAKLLFRFFSTSLFISHSLLPFLLSPKITFAYFFLSSRTAFFRPTFSCAPRCFLRPCPSFCGPAIIFFTLPLCVPGDLNPQNILLCPHSLIRL